MKYLLMIIIMFVPVLSYAQTGDVEKAGNALNELFRQQESSNNTNSKGSYNSTSSTTRGTATPRVVNRKAGTKTPEQYKKQFSNGMDAYSKANEESFKIGGKTPAQIAAQLMSGEAPADVTINYLKTEMAKRPITERHKIVTSVKKEAISVLDAHYNDYRTQYQKTESKFKSNGYSVTDKQMDGYVNLRMNGRKLNNVPQELVDEVDKSAVKSKIVRKDKERVSRLQTYLNEIIAECGGKCG